MKKVFIYLIIIYQKSFKLLVGNGTNVCRFYPTCSEYAKTAIDKKGIFQGTFLSIKRIAKCNPYSKGGYDPIN